MEDWRIAQEEAYREQDPQLRPLLRDALAGESERPSLSGLDERVYSALEQAGLERREAMAIDVRRGGRRWERLPDDGDITGRGVHRTVDLFDPRDGQPVSIDEGIAALVECCWALGITTTGSCQGDDRLRRAWLHFSTLDDCARFLDLAGAGDERPAMIRAALETMTPGPLAPLAVDERFWFYAMPNLYAISVGASFDPAEIPRFADLLLAHSLAPPASAPAPERGL